MPKISELHYSSQWLLAFEETFVNEIYHRFNILISKRYIASSRYYCVT